MIPALKAFVLSTDDFAAALANVRVPCEYTLQTGSTFMMDPNWATADYRAVVPAGTIIHMKGSRLVLRPDAHTMVSRPDARDLWGLTCGPNVRIDGGIIDANEQAFRNADPTKSWHSLGVWSPDGPLTTEDVWVENCRGLPETPTAISGLTVGAVEAFGFLLNGSTGGHSIIGGGVRNCPQNSYISGMNMGVVGANPQMSVCDGFTVDVSPQNWMGIGVNQNCDIKRFHLVGGCQRGIHNDTGVTEHVTVTSSHFNGVNYLLSMVSPGGIHRKVGIRFLASSVNFADGTAWLAELWDQSVAPVVPAVMGNIMFQALTVGARGAGMDTYITMAVRDPRPITIADCVLPAQIKSTAGAWLSLFDSPTSIVPV